MLPVGICALSACTSEATAEMLLRNESAKDRCKPLPRIRFSYTKGAALERRPVKDGLVTSKVTSE